MKRTAVLVLIVFFSAACASHPDKIQPTYCSPLQYENYSCSQIEQEIVRIEQELAELCGKQSAEAAKDAFAMTAGLLVFLPVLFCLIGPNESEQIAKLKGEYEALETLAIERDCDCADALIEARKAREKRLREEKEWSERSSHIDPDKL